MRWGSVVRVDLDPARGSEAGKTRPALVVANDAAVAAAERLGRGVVTVLPITTNIDRVFPFQLLITDEGNARVRCGLEQVSKVQTEQIRSVDVTRVVSEIGYLPSWLQGDVDASLRLHLNL